MDVQSPSGLSKKVMAAAMAAAVVLGAAGVANAVTAQDDTPTPTPATQDTTTDDLGDDLGDDVDDGVDDGVDDLDDDLDDDADDDDGDRGEHDVPLDEALAAQVTAAAEAAVPGGTVLEVEAEDDGYEAHVMGTDGIEVEVYFDQDFTVIEIVPED